MMAPAILLTVSLIRSLFLVVLLIFFAGVQPVEEEPEEESKPSSSPWTPSILEITGPVSPPGLSIQPEMTGSSAMISDDAEDADDVKIVGVKVVVAGGRVIGPVDWRG